MTPVLSSVVTPKGAGATRGGGDHRGHLGAAGPRLGGPARRLADVDEGQRHIGSLCPRRFRRTAALPACRRRSRARPRPGPRGNGRGWRGTAGSPMRPRRSPALASAPSSGAMVPSQVQVRTVRCGGVWVMGSVRSKGRGWLDRSCGRRAGAIHFPDRIHVQGPLSCWMTITAPRRWCCRRPIRRIGWRSGRRLRRSLPACAGRGGRHACLACMSTGGRHAPGASISPSCWNPRQPLAEARLAFVLGMVALGDALAAHCPPERAVTFGWPGEVLLDARASGRHALCRRARDGRG